MPASTTAIKEIAARDRVLARIIARVGPCTLRAEKDETFPALAESIVYQQLNGKAAATIHGRVIQALGGRATPRAFLKTPESALKAAGLSGGKFAAIKDLAEKCLSGEVPARAQLELMSDEAVIERLVAVRGIGVWTAQMFLMFRLARPDVLPSADFGIRKAFGLLYRKNGKLPPPSAVEKHGKLWAPHRTVASWYLWRSLELS